MILPKTICRKGLFVAQTTLVSKQNERLPFDGLFTSKTIPKGGFICFYQGEVITHKDRGNHYIYHTVDDDGHEISVSPDLTIDFTFQVAKGVNARPIIEKVRSTLLSSMAPIYGDRVERAVQIGVHGTRIEVAIHLPHSKFAPKVRSAVPTNLKQAQKRFGIPITSFEMRKGGLVNPAYFPGAMPNEPSIDHASDEANACFKEWADAADVSKLSSGQTLVISIHATRRIDADEEIFVHYEKGYDRSKYPDKGERVGTPTNVSKGFIAKAKERPADYLETHALLPPANAFLQ